LECRTPQLEFLGSPDPTTPTVAARVVGGGGGSTVVMIPASVKYTSYRSIGNEAGGWRGRGRGKSRSVRHSWRPSVRLSVRLPVCLAGTLWLGADTSAERHFGTTKLVPKCPDTSAPSLSRITGGTVSRWNCLASVPVSRPNCPGSEVSRLFLGPKYLVARGRSVR